MGKIHYSTGQERYTFPEECPITISELIEDLTEIKNKHGDLYVYIECRGIGGSYYEVDTPFIVVDEKIKAITL